MSNYNHLSVSTFGLFLLILCVPSYGRFITIRPLTSDLISDGVHDCDSAESSTSTCDQTYGFLPCTTSVMGNLFLMVVYGYLMYLAAKSLSDGSELLLEILGPGFVAGLVLPILGALPEALLVLVSGIFGTTETVQSQVSVGMGMVAGSTIVLLTIIWGSSVVVGKCDLVDSVAQDARDTKGFSLTESGVSTEIWTCYAAMIMVASIIPLLIVQIPQILNLTSGMHFAVLIGLIVSLLLLVSYVLYQVLQPDIQKRKIEYVKHKHFMLGLLRHLQKRAPGRLLDKHGRPDKGIIEKLFSSIDVNHDRHISHGELRALTVGIQFEEIDLNLDDAVNKLMIDFDTSGNSAIELSEFVTAMSNWLNKITATAARNAGLPSIQRTFDAFHRAAQLLLLGTIIAAAFADPLVDVVDNFSDATGIPAFFTSFIVLPLATSSRDAVSAIIFASRKKRSSASLTFYEIYGSVTMHNVFNLPVLLALVYFRGLTWDFSSEVLVILIVSIVIGALASFRTHFPMWTSILAFLLYPFSLVLVYVLHYGYGWS